MTSAQRHLIILILLSAAVGVAAILPFTSSIYCGFVWDDHILIDENPHLDDPGLAMKLLTSDYFAWSSKPSLSTYWRPLVRYSYLLDYKLYGLNPAGFHATNLLLLAAVTLLLFHLFRRLLSTAWAWGAALLFAWHPLRTEPVVWICGRTELLAALFGLAFLLLWIPDSNAGHPVIRRGAALLCLAGALLSKESAIMFIPLAAVLVPGRLRQHWKRFIPPLLLLTVYVFVRLQIFGTIRSWHHQYTSLLLLPAMALKTFFYYVKTMFYPRCLNTEPWFATPETYLDPQVMAGGVILAGVAFVIYRFRRLTAIRAGLAWFLLMLLPYLHIIAVPILCADRFTFLSGMGAALALAGALSAPSRKTLRISGGILLCVLLGAEGIASFNLVPNWVDDDAFQLRAMTCGRSARALYWVGNARLARGDIDGALKIFRTAEQREEKPSDLLAFATGLAYLSKGDVDQAEKYLQKAFRINPKHPKAGALLGELLLRRNKVNEARRVLEKTVRKHPKNASARLMLLKLYLDFDKNLPASRRQLKALEKQVGSLNNLQRSMLDACRKRFRSLKKQTGWKPPAPPRTQRPARAGKR